MSSAEMDHLINGYDLLDTGSASVNDLQLRNSNLFNLELPPLYPWAPDVSRSSSHRTLSGSRNFNGLSTGSSTSSELPAESDFIPTSSETGPARHMESVLPQKYFISNPQDEQLQLDRSSSNNSTPLASPTNNSKLPVISTSSHGYGVPSHPKKLHLMPRKRHVDVGIQTESVKSEKKKSHVSLLTLCKEMISMTMDRLRRQMEKEEDNETIIDQILTSCESVKMAIVNILEAYTRSQQLGSSGMAFADSDLVRVLSMQLVASLELVVSLTAVWMMMYSNTSSSSLTSITQSINSSINELATEILVFLQACETGTEDEAHSASTQIMELLSQLVKLCGQLALITDICPVSLYSPTSDSIDNMSINSSKDNDLVHMEPSSDLKQMFLQGADTFLDETLENSLQAIESSEMAAEALSPDDKGASKCEANSEVLKHVYITVATSKLLVLKTQQIQVELDSELREDHYRSEQYYLFFYKRCQSLLVYITRLSDNISLLVQAAKPLANDSQPDPGALMKVCRCSELIQRNAQKLVRTPVSDERKQNLDNSINQSVLSSLNGLSLDLSSLNSCESMASVVLSSKHLTELESSGDDVLLATKALIDLCRRELIPFKGTNYKVKRMLPVTPSGVRPVHRCRSARSVEQRSLSRNLSEADISQDMQD